MSQLPMPWKLTDEWTGRDVRPALLFQHARESLDAI